MRLIETSTGPIAIHENGAGSPIVLIHANPGNHRDFDAVIPALSERYRTIGVDLPGYGDSPIAEPRQASAMFFADAIEALACELAEPAVYIGNSVGGFAAARLAARRPELVSSLILVDSGGFSPPTLKAHLFCRFKGSEQVTRMIAGRFAKSYLKARNEWVEAILARTVAGARDPARVAVDAAVWRSFAHPDHDLREEATRITCPTLLVWGKHDPVLPVKPDALLAQELIPNARLAEMDTGHMAFAEDPPAFLGAVIPFIEVTAGASHSVASHS